MQTDGDPLGAAGPDDVTQSQVFKAKGSPADSNPGTPTRSQRLGLTGSAVELVSDGQTAPTLDNEIQSEEAEKLSSVLPTMWMGSQSGR